MLRDPEPEFDTSEIDAIVVKPVVFELSFRASMALSCLAMRARSNADAFPLDCLYEDSVPLLLRVGIAAAAGKVA